MERRGRLFWFGMIVGVGGLAVLLTLGFWQSGKFRSATERVERLAARMDAKPLQLGVDPLPNDFEYRAATAEGEFLKTQPARILSTLRPLGPGHLYVAPFRLNTGQVILVERGFAPDGRAAAVEPPSGPAALSGVLLNAESKGYFVSAPDLEKRLFFSRDVSALAALFDAQPIYFAQTQRALGAPRFPAPAPIQVRQPANHFGYAVTWFALAAVWTAMTSLLLFRRRRVSAK